MTSKWREIEQRFGKPMSEIITGLYEQFGDSEKPQETIASQMGISQPTLSQWIKYLRLTPKTIMLPEKPPKRGARIYDTPSPDAEPLAEA